MSTPCRKDTLYAQYIVFCDSLNFTNDSPAKTKISLLSQNVYHSKFLHELPDESLADLLPVAKKVANAIGAENYNILQNNGALAHQQVEHVHIHVIPKPNSQEGLGIGWPSKSTSKEDLAATAEKILQGFKD
ncbi:8850_t:CDS:2 [Acaulospora morrowiae]|uniref:8850_t:CDS:1 n=1 Tax=Acaulospora morrowiae TaxID=94023 RepID=A0A9N9NFK9_9GLOM|nr:8850_t:CDS:2 [Acaulospora morrowiae]